MVLDLKNVKKRLELLYPTGMNYKLLKKPLLISVWLTIALTESITGKIKIHETNI